MKIVIIGAGIAGLTAALAFAQKGNEVAVYEQAPALGEVGAGLQISPNGMRVFAALGVHEQVMARAFAPEAIEMRDGQTGRRIVYAELAKSKARWGGDYIHIHRAHLHEVLVQAAERRPGISLTLGVKMSEIDGNSVRISDGTLATGDLIIAADGVHSLARRQFFGDDQPRFTGYTAWRALVPIEALKVPPPPTACIWSGRGKHAVTTRIDGGRLINFVGITHDAEWYEDGWHIEAALDDLRAAFAEFGPVIQGVLSKVTAAKKWALLTRPKLEHWAQDMTVLIGDAAHPMLPSLAQGAVMAIEDAYLLAALYDPSLHFESLARFEALRLPRVEMVQAISLANAERFHRDGMMRTIEQSAARALTSLAPELFLRRYDWLYGEDITQYAP